MGSKGKALVISMSEYFDLLSVAAIAGFVVWLATTYAPTLREKVKAHRRRWRIEEIPCNKCEGSPKPGWKEYTTFNPATGEEETSLLSCDRCDMTGIIKIVVIPDDLDAEELSEMHKEIVRVCEDYSEMRTESEVSEASE